MLIIELMSQSSISIESIFNDDPGIPVEWHLNVPSSATGEDVCEWVTAELEMIDDAITNRGGLLLRGLHLIADAEAFHRVLEIINPSLRDYLGGTSPRDAVYGKVMTATSTPHDWSIILHQEMAYTSNPPDRISFFAELPASRGGHSVVGCMKDVVDLIDPDVRRRLEKGRLRLRRTLPSERFAHLKPGIQKTWSAVFQTDDRAEVERVAESKGWAITWLRGGSLQLLQEAVPPIRSHRQTGREVWCNQAHFFPPVCMMAWAKSDGRQQDHDALHNAYASTPELLDTMCLADGEPVAEADALHLFEVMKSIERAVKLQKSDILLLDNILFSHGRTAFQGQRRILVGLSDHSRTHRAA